MACLHFSPKLLETNEHSKGAIPFITAISLNWPFFFFNWGKKLNHLRRLFLKEKIFQQKLTFKNESQKKQ